MKFLKKWKERRFPVGPRTFKTALAVVLAIDYVLDAEGADVDMSVDNG